MTEVIAKCAWCEAPYAEGFEVRNREVLCSVCVRGYDEAVTSARGVVVSSVARKALPAGIPFGVFAELTPSVAVNVPEASSLTEAQRASRELPGVSFSAALAGAPSPKRARGFYWVRDADHLRDALGAEVFVAQWFGGEWAAPGTDATIGDEMVVVVAGPIAPPSTAVDGDPTPWPTETTDEIARLTRVVESMLRPALVLRAVLSARLARALRRVIMEADVVLAGGDDPADVCTECGTAGVGRLRDALSDAAELLDPRPDRQVRACPRGFTTRLETLRGLRPEPCPPEASAADLRSWREGHGEWLEACSRTVESWLDAQEAGSGRPARPLLDLDAPDIASGSPGATLNPSDPNFGGHPSVSFVPPARSVRLGGETAHYQDISARPPPPTPRPPPEGAGVRPLGPSLPAYEAIQRAHAMGLPAEGEPACSLPLECGALCGLLPNHDGDCLCGGETDGPGTCPG